MPRLSTGTAATRWCSCYIATTSDCRSDISHSVALRVLITCWSPLLLRPGYGYCCLPSLADIRPTHNILLSAGNPHCGGGLGVTWTHVPDRGICAQQRNRPGHTTSTRRQRQREPVHITCDLQLLCWPALVASDQYAG